MVGPYPELRQSSTVYQNQRLFLQTKSDPEKDLPLIDIHMSIFQNLPLCELKELRKQTRKHYDTA